jgi:HlyD family secretion protein
MADLTANGTSEEWYADVPRSVTKHVILGTLLLILAFGGFGLWAFRAPLAAAVIAQGSFVATGQNKIIQHLEGGIIEQIMVREGDRVQIGDVLLRLDQTASMANERELELRRIRLEATAARLVAEHTQQDRLAFAPVLEAGRDDPEISAILDGQLLAFEVSQSALENDVSVLQGNIDALVVRTVGYAAQLTSFESQHRVFQGDYESKQSLLDRGLVRRSDVTALETAMLETEGQIGRLQAEVNEIAEIQLRHQTQIEQARQRYRQTALEDLQTIQAQLDSIREQSRTAQDVRERAEVLAPVSGRVVRLYYHTAGGVVESGRPILEILPEDAALIIETQVPRSDIDSVRTGQEATVRLVALNQRTTPVLMGEVFYVSADSVTDSSSGVPAEVYVARVSIDPDQLRLVPGFTPTPGMPAEIMIQTAERTFAQYLAKPIRDSMIRAFREE